VWPFGYSVVVILALKIHVRIKPHDSFKKRYLESRRLDVNIKQKNTTIERRLKHH
jgi:hypothetical protein